MTYFDIQSKVFTSEYMLLQQLFLKFEFDCLFLKKTLTESLFYTPIDAVDHR